MSLVVKILLAIVIVLFLAVSILRIRKLRRDEFRGQAVAIDRRLMTPPPSPYTTSKGFRLLDDVAPSSEHPPPPRPRLEPDREYVFSDAQLPPYEISNLGKLRHDEKWALSRSAHRSRFSVTAVRLIAVAILVIAVVVCGFLFFDHHPPKTTTTSTTTSTTIKATGG